MAANQETRLTSDKPEGSFWKRQVFDTFISAGGGFVRHEEGTVKIWAASRDWFMEEWGRDTFISLPGILLVTGRFNEAKEIFRNFAGHRKGGIIPNRIQKGKETEYNTADASLWYIQALKSCVEYSKDVKFAIELIPAITDILDSYRKGTHYFRFGYDQKILMDEKDCLVISPAQATWMDADPSGKGKSIVTPRNGKAVEINALWYSNLRFAASILAQAGHFSKAKEYNHIADKARISFNAKFWNSREEALLDVVDGDSHGGAIRPNMLFAVSNGGDLLSPIKQAAVFRSAKKDLLTPGGLRTLSPRDSHYKGHYDTYLPIEQKDWAYHQGTAWPWLMGAYCDSLAIVRKNQGKTDEAIRHEISLALYPLAKFCMDSPYKSLPEVFSGEPPYEPGGTTSQAWSVAEVLRVLDKFKIISDR